MKNLSFLVLSVLFLFACSDKQDKPSLSITSPSGKITVLPVLDNSLGLGYSIKFGEQEVLTNSKLGMEIKGYEGLWSRLKIASTEINSVDDSWERVWGRNKTVVDQYNELVIHLEGAAKIDVIFRAYNDGVAFRYMVPEQEGLTSFELTNDLSSFQFSSDKKVWAVDYDSSFVNPQEGQYPEKKLSDLGQNLTGCPLLVEVSYSLYVALTEANLTDWAGTYYTRSGENEMKCTLSPRLDDPSVLVKRDAPAASPWRVIMIAENAGRFLETDILANLNDPCELEDVSWIKPGKSAWDWWWSNSNSPEVDFELGANQETMKYYIDFAAEIGWEYQLVDWKWYGEPFAPTEDNPWNPTPDADITTMNPDIDIPELVKYANEKGVKILLWLQYNHAFDQMEKAFPLYEQWGVAGVKVDFMNRDDQQMVQMYHKLVKLAAKHHLTVDYHGAYKPTGFSRTYPNLMTREGVMGNEWNKWNDMISPEHTVTLPFTRGILGEMDFTPGGFSNVAVADFKAETEDDPHPKVMGTRCRQLSMLVIYESALQVLCDSPYNYKKKSDGLEFLKLVPTSWDETKVLNAKVADYITVARRAGDTWYVGSMTDADSRSLTVDFSFLDEGEYTATCWEDSEEATDAVKTEKVITSNEKMTINLAEAGGHVMVITKK